MKEINAIVNKEEKENNSIEQTEIQNLLYKEEKENEKIENKEKTEIPKKKPRQSNIELLRIIAMLLIVFHHFAVHGNFYFSNEEKISVNQFWLRCIAIGGRVAVDTYVLNSGYFLINSKSVKINKVLKMLFQMYTYAFLDFFVGYFV